MKALQQETNQKFIFKIVIKTHSTEHLHGYYSSTKKVIYVDTIEKARLILNCAEKKDFKNKGLDQGMIISVRRLLFFAQLISDSNFVLVVFCLI